MNDLTIVLENRPGALAEMGEALGEAGVSVDRLILVVDEPDRARSVASAWMAELDEREHGQLA